MTNEPGDHTTDSRGVEIVDHSGSGDVDPDVGGDPLDDTDDVDGRECAVDSCSEPAAVLLEVDDPSGSLDMPACSEHLPSSREVSAGD